MSSIRVQFKVYVWCFVEKLYEKLQKSKSDGYDCEENSKEPRKLLQSEENHVLFPIFINQFLISLPYFRKKCETLYERCSSKNRFWWIASYVFVVYLEFTGYTYHPHIYFHWICGTFTIKMFIIKLLDAFENIIDIVWDK